MEYSLMENRPHPTKDITGIKSNKLQGKNICICMTGSVAVINTPTVARELMRHGAEVKVVMSKEATRLITPTMMEWSTGNPVITEISGQIEHVMLAGERENSKGWADMILVCPATANTISKIAMGIDDTPVTTVCTVAMGSRTPLVIVPAMHDSMYRHPIVQENIEKLKSFKVTFLGPRMLENKAKVAEPLEITEHIIDYFNSKNDLEGINFLITAGPSREMIDRVRFLSNPSTGKMGMALAQEILSRGGKVTVIFGPGTAETPIGARILNVVSAGDFIEKMKEQLSENQYHVLISAAALADFTPEQMFEEKISSDLGSLQINLIPTRKLIKNARKLHPNLYIAGFKAESDVNGNLLVEKAFLRLKSSNLNLIVANNVNRKNLGRGFGTDTNEVFIIDRNKNVTHVNLTSKREVASRIIDAILKNLQINN
jgi:phosphopantothenoylcysteine decarboxylase / phosphopantothenate---cysteine ligase